MASAKRRILECDLANEIQESLFQMQLLREGSFFGGVGRFSARNFEVKELHPCTHYYSCFLLQLNCMHCGKINRPVE